MTVADLREQLFLSAEIEAERFLSILRIAVSLALASTLAATLYAMPEPPIAPIRRQIGTALLVLLLYLVVGIASFRLAEPRRFRTWMPWLFTTADCALVLFNIATTALHVGLSSKALWLYPPTWIVPLVMAFGTLRYRPGLQAYAVLLLVGGSLLLIVGLPELPLALDRLMPLLAMPPTVIRIAALTLLGAVLVIAAIRRRALLQRAIGEAVERTNLARYLPPEIGALLASGDVDRLRRGWQVEIGLLIVDIRGFTARAEAMDPPSLAAFLGRFRHEVIETATAHGGVVDKFVGDNALIVFGVPETSTDDAARALLSARTLLGRIEAWNAAEPGREPVRLGIGAHWGPAFAGAVGDDSRLEFTVLGDTVNVASRLEQLTKDRGGGLVASKAIVERAGEHGGWRPLPSIALRGRTRPLDILVWEG